MVYTRARPVHNEHRPWLLSLGLGVFIYALVSNVLLGGMTWNSLFAPDMMWTGVFSLVSIILIAWTAAPRLTWQVLAKFFYAMSLVAALSLLYDLSAILHGHRLGGLVVQPNILAIILGAGLIAGLYTQDAVQIRWRVAGSLLTILAILLTQTRGVILLLPFIIYPAVAKQLRAKPRYMVLLLGLGVFFALIAAPRLANLSRLKYGVTYRYDLVIYSSRYTQVMPPWGFGPGGLTEVAGDYYTMPPSIEATAKLDQKLPESSHVIVVDRFIEYGWLGGLSYLLIVVLFIFQAIKKRQDSFVRVLAGIGLFVLIQQLITVPRFHSELIAWVAMLGVIMHDTGDEDHQDA